MEKHIITYYEITDPTSSNNIAAGYALGQRWFNSSGGTEYLHTSDGVWVSTSGEINVTTGYTSSPNPINYKNGDEWIDNDNLIKYTLYDDGTTKQWIVF